jgi:hypothetical protein
MVSRLIFKPKRTIWDKEDWLGKALNSACCICLNCTSVKGMDAPLLSVIYKEKDGSTLRRFASIFLLDLRKERREKGKVPYPTP